MHTRGKQEESNILLFIKKAAKAATPSAQRPAKAALNIDYFFKKNYGF